MVWGGVKAEVTWNAVDNWTQNDYVSAYYFGITTPGTTDDIYIMSSFSVYTYGDKNTSAYAAITSVNPNTTDLIPSAKVLAVSTNKVITENNSAYNKYQLFTLSKQVPLKGGTMYYIVFLGSDTPTSSKYSICDLRIGLKSTTYSPKVYWNTTGSNGYAPGFTANLQYEGRAISVSELHKDAYYRLACPYGPVVGDLYTNMYPKAEDGKSTATPEEAGYFLFESDGDGYYTIKTAGGKYLYVKNAAQMTGVSDDTKVGLTTEITDAAKWKLTNSDSGIKDYFISPKNHDNLFLLYWTNGSTNNPLGLYGQKYSSGNGLYTTIWQINDIDGIESTSIVDNGLYTLQCNRDNTFYMSSSFTASSLQKMLIKVEDSKNVETVSSIDYKLYYLYSVLDGKYLKSTRSTKGDGSSNYIKCIDFAEDKEHATTFTFRPTEKSTVFNICPKDIAFSLTPWNTIEGYYILNYDSSNDLAKWNLVNSSIGSVMHDYVENYDIEGKLEKAGDVGYPKTSKSTYTTLKNYIDNWDVSYYTVSGYSTLKANYDAYIAESDVVLPKVGKFYTLYQPTNNRYIHAVDPNNLLQMDADGTSPDAIFYIPYEGRFLSYTKGYAMTGRYIANGYYNPSGYSTYTIDHYSDHAFGTIRIKSGGMFLVDDSGHTDIYDSSYGTDANRSWIAGEVTSLPVALKSIDNHGYASLYTPVAISSLPEGVKAYIATIDKSAERVRFTEITSIPANTGVVLYKSDCTQDATVDLAIGAASATTTGNVLSGVVATSALGSQEVMTMQNGSNGLGFYKYNGTNLNGFKAYINIDATTANVKSFIFDFEDDADVILSPSGEIKDEAIYNLSGQRLNKLQKGINIVNGKKVFIK